MLFLKQRIRYLVGITTLLFLLSALVVTSLTLSTDAHATGTGKKHKGFYEQTNLVSNLAGIARFQDTRLVNPWGIVLGPRSLFQIADNGTGLSTSYTAKGQPQPQSITIPLPPGSTASNAAPTGIVFNRTKDFVVHANGKASIAVFIFSTEDGTISAWDPRVDRTHAILVVDRSKVGAGAVYKGLASGRSNGHNLLFATNFRAGAVEVFNANFNFVRSFTDPFVPQGFAPFGIQNINGLLFVTFAKQDAAKHDDVAGPGNGFVDVFNTSGHLLKRLISRGVLNSPWGLTLAPSNFGPFSNDLLVGNFGDSTINAFNARTGKFEGTIRGKNGKPLGVDDNPLGSKGLWGLIFGDGTRTGGSRNTLFFTAGIDDETNGLFAAINFVNR